jgi:hypothetical protein
MSGVGEEAIEQGNYHTFSWTGMLIRNPPSVLSQLQQEG